MAGDPNALADIFNVQVDFVPAVPEGRFGFGNATYIADFAANASFPGRIKEYTGTQTQKLAALLADGFTSTSDTYRQVRMANLQKGPARTMYVGRRTPAEIWADALDAIKLQADTDGLSFYAFVSTTRDAAEIEAIADWQEGVPGEEKFTFYEAQTDDPNVIADNPGNLARNILAKNYKQIALTWHDPEASSKYGPAVLQSAVGPFNIADAANIQLRIDGAATQNFVFSVSAATLLGSIAATYLIANGDTLVFAANGGSNQTITYETSAATILCLSAETYNFVDGLTLNVRVDGGTAQPVGFNGTAGAFTTAAEPYVGLAAETLTLKIDGGANQVTVFGAGDVDAATVGATIDAATTGVNVTSTTTVTVASARLGNTTNARVEAITATAAIQLALAVGDNLGSGFAGFLDVATAAEVAAEIVLDTADLTSVADTAAVRITSVKLGTLSRIQVTGGTANALLGFDTNELAGEGDFADASVATATEIIDKINANATGARALVETAKVRLTSTIIGSSSVIDVAASNVATALGLSLTAVTVTGDFVDASQASSAEVSNVIGLTLTDATASSSESRVKITSTSQGTAATVEAVGGTLLNTLFFVDATTSVKNLATGIGVQEDFFDAGWMGYCITFDLDATRDEGGGAALWNSVQLLGPSPTGAGTVSLPGDRLDSITVAQRELLHDTLRVNTYELRNGANVTHFGTLLNDKLGAGGYIDVRTTIDWMKARIVEKFVSIDLAASAQKTKYAYAPSGVDVYDQGLREVLAGAEPRGHTFYDSSPLDLNNAQDTGVYTPTIAQQTQLDINQRLIDGFRAQQLIQGGIQRGNVIVNLLGPTAE